jgi:phosphatidylethanolamine/phosphatidyl-N-methylethanolamine N-methyltransferase
MKWFKPGPPPYQTALAMIGAKRGDRLLVIGAGTGDLPAQLALVTGLNGTTLVVDRSPDARARVESAATEAGALVEFEPAPPTMLPQATGGFDLVVIQHELSVSAARARVAVEAARVVRPGGRVIVVEKAARPGVFGVLSRTVADIVPAATLRDLLVSVGLRAARVLAERDGVSYVEGVKPKT